MTDPVHLFYLERDFKYGGFDFGVSRVIGDFTIEEMNQFRSMLIVAIGTMEDMFRREQERKHPAAQALPLDAPK